jgi:hypothetical protein
VGGVVVLSYISFIHSWGVWRGREEKEGERERKRERRGTIIGQNSFFIAFLLF